MTKNDGAKIKELTEQQLAGIELLSSGTNITDTAKQLDVARQTVSEWLNHSAVFQAGLNGRRQELRQDSQDKLRSLLPKAIDILEKEMENGDNKLKAALALIKIVGLDTLPAIGETNPELAGREQRIIEDEKKRSLSDREMFAAMSLR